MSSLILFYHSLVGKSITEYSYLINKNKRARTKAFVMHKVGV